MSAALASVLALGTAIVLSMVSRINVGLVAIAAAWIIGVYVAGMKPEAVLSGFPASLFLTLCGVTLLFAVADANKSLAGLAARAAGLIGRNTIALPIAFFLLGFSFSAIGPGAVPATALLAPLAVAIGARSAIPPLLTVLMVANGANAGNLSPISAVGIIANSRMASVGLVGHESKVMLANLLAHALVAVVVFVAFLPRLRTSKPSDPAASAKPEPFSRSQLWTLTIIAAWVAGVVVLKLNVGLSAFAAALILIAIRAADEAVAIRAVPWSIILMVTGVAVLIAVLEASGGMELFTRLLASIASPSTVNGVVALVTGAISTYSSTSGVVLPAFLPTSQNLVQQVGGGDPLAVALSINVGASLVDVSPLSTIGALCVAAVSDPAQSRRLFYQLLAWGFSMIAVGAMLCQLFASALARA
jgi:Na+/H+ antiporter NhaD/arsenite permease-like protein